VGLSGKRIIVTGGAQGIGESAVRAFVSAGAIVTSLDILEDMGAEVCRQASSAGPGSAAFITCDVSNRGQVDSAFDQAVSVMGGLDVLAHIAGVHRHAPTHDVPGDVIQWTYAINVNGTIYTNGAAYRHMHQSGGAIINFGSESGLTAEINNAVYGSSKAAVHAWTRSVAREWGAKNIRVNAVLPYVVTPMYARFREALSSEDLAAHDRATAEQIPLGGKFGDPDRDLSPVLVFLAGDGSRFITGQLIPVDGGLISVR
jgi:3-oxoacyl-[acyl-carrier protein] reductase